MPAREAIDELGTQLDKIARFGFYNLNLDLYIDTDRVAGLGRPHHAPRPPRRDRSVDRLGEGGHPDPPAQRGQGRAQAAAVEDPQRGRQEESSSLTDAEIEALKKQIPVDVEERIFFPTQIHVRGQKISFFVPGIVPRRPGQGHLGLHRGHLRRRPAAVASTSTRKLGRDPDDEVADDPPRLPRPLAGPLRRRPRERRHPAAADRPHRAQGRPTQEQVLADFDARAKKPVVLPGVVPAEQK